MFDLTILKIARYQGVTKTKDEELQSCKDAKGIDQKHLDANRVWQFIYAQVDSE
jgi:hypothetical protein